MPDIVFVVELATDSLGVVAEETVEHSVCHQHTIRISIPPARFGYRSAPNGSVFFLPAPGFLLDFFLLPMMTRKHSKEKWAKGSVA